MRKRGEGEGGREEGRGERGEEEDGRRGRGMRSAEPMIRVSDQRPFGSLKRNIRRS